MAYAIVEFLSKGKSKKTVDIIPTNWFVTEEEDQCFWPKVVSSMAIIMVKEKASPQAAWPKYNLRVLGKAGTMLLI
jgi:hypothetical protein